jgi:hypothetical protein
MRERFANLMLEVRPQPVSDAHMESSGEATDPVEQIANAKKLLESGAIDQTEFEKLKQKAIG